MALLTSNHRATSSGGASAPRRPASANNSSKDTLPNSNTTHRAPKRNKTSNFVGVRHKAIKPNREAIKIQALVEASSTSELLERYHELADKRLEAPLQYLDLFELDQIEARLDAEDGDGEASDAFMDDWRREREHIIGSIEHLLDKLKTNP